MYTFFSKGRYFIVVHRYNNLIILAEECKVHYFSTHNLDHLLSSTFESSCVTFMDKFWILSWREFVLWKILFVAAQSSPKRSSACFEMLLSCRMIPHNVFTDTASSSLFNPSSNFPRLNSIGSTDRFINGMVDYQTNQHRRINAKIPVFLFPSPDGDKTLQELKILQNNFHPRSNTQHGDFLLPRILCKRTEKSCDLRKATTLHERFPTMFQSGMERNVFFRLLENLQKRKTFDIESQELNSLWQGLRVVGIFFRTDYRSVKRTYANSNQ